MLPVESWQGGFDERFPIYRQIIDRFSRAFIKGELRAGDRIPSIRELSMTLKVNTNTIQRAYQEMERAEFISPQRGLGYFVMANDEAVARVKKTMVDEAVSLFLQDMRALGFGDGEIVARLQEAMMKGGDRDDAVDHQGA